MSPLRLKTAKIEAIAWALDCPECDSPIPNPEGSYCWSEPASGQTTAVCEYGGHIVKLPRRFAGTS